MLATCKKFRASPYKHSGRSDLVRFSQLPSTIHLGNPAQAQCQEQNLLPGLPVPAVRNELIKLLCDEAVAVEVLTGLFSRIFGKNMGVLCAKGPSH